MLIHEQTRATLGTPKDLQGARALCRVRCREELEKQGHECDLFVPMRPGKTHVLSY